jgi:hypothetical protein
VYFADTTAGDVTLTVPASIADNNGDRYRFFKESGDTNDVVIQANGGQTIGAVPQQFVRKGNQGFSILSDFSDTNWKIIQSSRSSANTIIVSDTGGDFTTPEAAVTWANTNATSNVLIKIDSGTYTISSTLTVTNSNIIGIVGSGYKETVLVPAVGLVGSPIISLQVPTNINRISFDAGTVPAYATTSGSIAIEVANGTDFVMYFDHIRFLDCYTCVAVNGGGFPFQQVNIIDCIMGEGNTHVTIDNGAVVIMSDNTLGNAVSSYITISDTAGGPTRSQLSLTGGRFSGVSVSTGTILTANDQSFVRILASYFDTMANGFVANDTSHIKLQGCGIDNISGTTLNQSSASATIEAVNCAGDFRNSNMVISNLGNFVVSGYCEACDTARVLGTPFMIGLTGTSARISNTWDDPTMAQGDTGALATQSSIKSYVNNQLHNGMTGIQGGTSNEHYHLTQDNYSSISGFVTIENTDIDIGTETVDTFSDTTGDSAVWDFVVKSGTNLRAGTLIAVWEATGDTVEYTEYSTKDIGNTNPLILSVDIDSDNVRLRATATTDNWSVKARRQIL